MLCRTRAPDLPSPQRARRYGNVRAVIFVCALVPGRVIKNQDPDAHAEREAIRDAQRRLGKADLTGAVLYSTSRPCSRCEAAAARAKLSRMFFGADLADAGAPRAAQEQRQAR